MTVLRIQEYVEIGRTTGAGVPVGMEPPVANQKTTYTSTSVPSAAFNAKTNFVRLIATGDTLVKFGTGTPVAATAEMFIKAGVAEYFGIPVGQSYKVAAIDLV